MSRPQEIIPDMFTSHMMKEMPTAHAALLHQDHRDGVGLHELGPQARNLEIWRLIEQGLNASYQTRKTRNFEVTEKERKLLMKTMPPLMKMEYMKHSEEVTAGIAVITFKVVKGNFSALILFHDRKVLVVVR